MTKYFQITAIHDGGLRHKCYIVDENWRLKHNEEGQLTVIGSLLEISTASSVEKPGTWHTRVPAIRFVVEDANAQCTKLYQAAVDLHQVEAMADAIRSFTAEYFEAKLNPTIRDIIKRTPATFDIVVKAVGDGFAVAKEKIQQGGK